MKIKLRHIMISSLIHFTHYHVCFILGRSPVHNQKGFRVQQGDADISSLEDGQQEVWSDLSNGCRC